MLISGQPSVRRRRGGNKRIVIPVAAVAALGLGAGVFVAASGGGSPAKIHQAAATSSQGVSSSAVNTTCDIVIPAHPLTAKGLATPFLLTGPAGTSPAASGCQMINSLKLGAFAQATIVDPATGKLFVYNPLVITKGTKPAVKPVVPKLPRHAVVTIDIGFNGTILTQVGATPLGAPNTLTVAPEAPVVAADPTPTSHQTPSLYVLAATEVSSRTEQRHTSRAGW